MQVQNLSVDAIELDLENPRIARMIEMYDVNTLSAEQIALALGAGDSQEGETYTTFRSLKESIRTHGGIIHPIIVNRTNGVRTVVIEGNTRLQIYREFLAEGLDGNWTEIPCVVHDNLHQRAIDAIRLQAHLVGPRPWEPYSKARYITRLRNSDHLTIEQIIEFCGGRRRQVQDFIAAYQDMEQHYRPQLKSPADFDASRFSSFVEYQKPNIQRAVVGAGFGKNDFAKWVMNGLLSPQQMVRQLPRILFNERAREVFLEDGAREACRLLDQEPQDTSLENATLSQLASELSRRIGRLPFNDFQRIRSNPDGDEFGILFDAKSVLDEFFQSHADD